MKKWYLFFLTIVLIACYDDEGSYSYKELNDVTIGGIIDNDWYNKFTYVDTLRINPKLTLALGGTEDHLKFEWRLMPIKASYNNDSIPSEEQLKKYIIGNEKNLAYPLREQAGDYLGFFWVTDTLTNVSYKKDFFVRLRTAVTDGWMLLCEENGKASLDMVSHISATENIVSRGIWSECDFEFGKPYKLIYNYNRAKSSRLLWCEAGTFDLDKEKLQPSEESDLIYQFGDNPEKVKIAGGGLSRCTDPAREMLITADGDLYFRDARYISLGSIFDFPRNKLKKTSEYFKVSPFVVYKGFWEWPTTTAAILYDETNRRFVMLESKEEYLTELFFIGGDMDYKAETGRDMVHMEGNNEGYVFAVLKEPGRDEYYVYGMVLNGDCKVERSHYMRLNLANSDKITKFAFHPFYRLLFYATEQGDIYQFNMNTPDEKAKKILSFPNEHISVLKFNLLVPYIQYADWEREREKWLIIAGYDKTKEETVSGALRMYEFQEVTSAPKLKMEFTDLGKIVDAAYRFRNDESK